MIARLVVVVALGLSGMIASVGCLRSTSFQCDGDESCTIDGVGGHCESDGFCSYDDASCDGGRRYGAAAGALAGQCVSGQAIDGGLGDAGDAAADAADAAGTISTSHPCIVHAARDLEPLCPEVCELAPHCCDTMWDEACIQLAERTCALPCSSGISFGGYVSVTVGYHEGPGWTPVWTPALAGSDQFIVSLAWADHDDDGDADLAAAGECQMHIFENQGYDLGGTLMMVPTFRETGSTGEVGDDGCPISDGQRYGGNRAAWADVDGDGDLDAVFGGVHGLFVVDNDAGTFTRGATIVGDGATFANVGDFAWADFDGDHDLDLFVGNSTSAAPLSQLLRNGGDGTLVPVADWTGPDEVAVATWCYPTPTAPPVLLVGGGGKLSLFANDGEVATLPSTLNESVFGIACGDLDGEPGIELATLGYDTLQIRRLDLSVRWDSLVDLGRTYQSYGFALGNWEGDDADLDIVLSENPDSEVAEPFSTLINDSSGGDLLFADGPRDDFIANRDTVRASFVYLPPPPR